jgi:TonB family protein
MRTALRALTLCASVGCASQVSGPPAAPSQPAPVVEVYKQAPVETKPDASAPTNGERPPPEQEQTRPNRVNVVDSEYPTQLYNRFRSNWNLPPGFSVKDLAALTTTIAMKIEPDGSISGVRVAHRSGVPEFDDACLRAVTATKSVPPPPPEMSRLYQRGLILMFESKELLDQRDR